MLTRSNIILLASVASTTLISRSYVFLLVIGAISLLLCIRAGVRKIGPAFFIGLSLLVWVALLAVREVFLGSPYVDYYLSSFVLHFGILLILTQNRLDLRFFEKLSAACFWTLLFQAILIYLRFLQIYEFPIIGGEAPGNRGIISFQSREQLTAISMSIQLIFFLTFSRSAPFHLRSILLLLFTCPAVFLTGSTLATFIWIFSGIYCLLSSILITQSLMRYIFISLLLALILSFAGLIGVEIQNIFAESGGRYFEAVSVVNQFTDLELLTTKVVDSNSRFHLYEKSWEFVSRSAQHILFGGSRAEFLALTGGLSPHGLLPEVITSAGLPLTALLLVALIALYFYSFRLVGVWVTSYFFISLFLATSINSINLIIPWTLVILLYCKFISERVCRK